MKPVIKTISEVKDAKEHLEDQISCLLMQFEKDNGIKCIVHRQGSSGE